LSGFCLRRIDKIWAWQRSGGRRLIAGHRLIFDRQAFGTPVFISMAGTILASSL
jgi:hypothetical protein